MARAVWSGTISFGLVSVPVRLYPATRRKDIRFHEIDRSSGQRIRHQKVIEAPWSPPIWSAAGKGEGVAPTPILPDRGTALRPAKQDGGFGSETPPVPQTVKPADVL